MQQLPYEGDAASYSGGEHDAPTFDSFASSLRQTSPVKKDPMVWDPPTDRPVRRQNSNTNRAPAAGRPVAGNSGATSVKRNLSTKAVGSKTGTANMGTSNAMRKSTSQSSALDASAVGNTSTSTAKPRTLSNGRAAVANLTYANVDTTASNVGADRELQPVFDTTGWERELVDAIERDILQRYPKVNWHDIAGLDQAKDLLKEAAVLPTLMPNFFKVRHCGS
jgi:katanin p60 ATPase-containing subunit A1